MDISKITAAAVAQTNEFQLALASLNFDFSLFKVEAPQEYKAVGMSLSPSRKQNAEEGPAHRTAQKLDAIIGSMVTPPDTLVKVYGQRVSGICSTPSSNPRGSRAHGMFQNYVGADSTTIWAAATSGKGALAVHLLASQISAECDPNEPSHYALIWASHLEVTRAELANWDAGARAWLAIADKANQRQHSQLRLIIENLSISVNNNSVVFSSVIKAWQSAMEMVQNLLMGISQRVNSGAVLLALSAWHHYPDMDVFCVAIVGLEDADPSHSTGIFWSLSLSHLRYYGDPVLCRRSVAEDASRGSFNEFTLVALGSFL
ncbi:hypothetical protein G4B11_004563 [Aspergillus flavus]|nr:hypothetical protein G4B11_004563 [Aspergillus flavus]